MDQTPRAPEKKRNAYDSDSDSEDSESEPEEEEGDEDEDGDEGDASQGGEAREDDDSEVCVVWEDRRCLAPVHERAWCGVSMGHDFPRAFGF